MHNINDIGPEESRRKCYEVSSFRFVSHMTGICSKVGYNSAIFSNCLPILEIIVPSIFIIVFNFLPSIIQALMALLHALLLDQFKCVALQNIEGQDPGQFVLVSVIN